MYDENRDGVVDSWYAHPRNPVVPLYGPFEPPAERSGARGARAEPVEPGRLRRLARRARADRGARDRRRARLAAGVGAAALLDDRLRGPHRVLRALDLREGARLPERRRPPLLPAGELVLRRRAGRGRRPSTARRTATALRPAPTSRSRPPASAPAAGPTRSARSTRSPPARSSRCRGSSPGTGVQDGDPFGIALGEVDTVDPKLSPPGTVTVATATVPAFTPVPREGGERAGSGRSRSRTRPPGSARRRSRSPTLARARARSSRGGTPAS